MGELERLVDCIKKGDNNQLQKLVSIFGRDFIHSTTPAGTPLLNVAILHNNHTAARLLLDRGVDPCFQDQNGKTALHAAAEVENLSVIVNLLKKCTINAQDRNGNTALHLAAQNTSVEMVKWLVFGGADPFILNKKGSPCRKLTKQNLIHQILRDFNPNRPPIAFAKLVTSQPYTSEGLPFSAQISRSSTLSSSSTDFLFYSLSYRSVSSANLGHLKEEEEIWGPVVEYRLTQSAVKVDLNFPLQDMLESSNYELVLGLIDTDRGGARYEVLDVKEGTPPIVFSSEEHVRFVAYADVRVTLDDAGMLFLLCRPVQQPVELHKGATKVKAKVDERVQLSVPEDFEGTIKGELQLEKSVLVKEEVALARAPPAKSAEYESQTDYVKLTTQGRQPESATPKLTVDLPLPPGYRGGPLNVYVRTTSQESNLSTFSSDSHSSTDSSQGRASGSLPKKEEAGRKETRRSSQPKRDTLQRVERDARRRLSHDSVDFSFEAFQNSQSKQDPETSSASEYDSEDDNEARKWWRTDSVSVPKNADTIHVPMVPNKTMTVVETKKAVSEESLKKKIGKQYRKRLHKRAVFFVAGKAWAGWRECREVLVVVTSPLHLSMELARQLKDNYSLLYVSGEFRVPPLTEFRVSTIGDLLVEHGEAQATITFQHVVRTHSSPNSCTFVLRKRSERTTQGRLLIEKKRKKQKKSAKGADPMWKYKGELNFDMGSITNELKPQGMDQSDLSEYFSDTLLLDMAEKLPPSEANHFGIRLGLTSIQVDGVMSNPSLFNPVFKCFELMRRQRDRCSDAVTFGKQLVSALRSMEWNQQREWLFSRLSEWPQLDQLEKD